MNEEQVNEYRQWYFGKRPLHEGLSDIVRSIIESLLKHASIDYLSVSSRTKSIDSFSEKIQQKEYEKPEEECTDLSGIRVITYIESDVTKVAEIIRNSFKIFPELSFDKSEELGVDRVGYRSVHFVCDLGSDRAKLPEFTLYTHLKFEVQIRTVLQHAWAEIEHDRNYKFSGILPTALQRRLYTLAGLLEIVDREFVALAKDVDNYSEDVAKKTKEGNLNVEVNTTSLVQYLPNRFEELDGLTLSSSLGPSNLEKVTAELQNFGIRTLSELNALYDEKLLSLLKHSGVSSYPGLLRAAMLYADIEHYFESAWNHNWSHFHEEAMPFLIEKYGEDKVRQIMKDNGIAIGKEEEFHSHKRAQRSKGMDRSKADKA